MRRSETPANPNPLRPRSSRLHGTDQIIAFGTTEPRSLQSTCIPHRPWLQIASKAVHRCHLDWLVPTRIHGGTRSWRARQEWLEPGTYVPGASEPRLHKQDIETTLNGRQKNRQGGITPCSESLACASKATKRVYSFSLASKVWLELVSLGTARPCQALQAVPLRRPSSVAAASEPAALRLRDAPRQDEDGTPNIG